MNLGEAICQRRRTRLKNVGGFDLEYLTAPNRIDLVPARSTDDGVGSEFLATP
jgi:hypothetical protein